MPSVSTGLIQTVNPAASTTSLASSLNPSTFGQPVTFTATVTGGAGVMPTGAVTFKDGAMTLGTVSLTAGQASFVMPMLTAGSHAITAVYSGDANYTSSSAGLTQTVNKAATATILTSSINPSTYGQSITFTATVTGGVGMMPSMGTVTFKDGATVLGMVTLTPAVPVTFTTSLLTTGSHSITAVYSGDGNYTSSTGALTQAVNQAPTTTTVSSMPWAMYGMPIAYTATVTGVAGAALPTGIVTFKDGAVTLGSGSLTVVGGVAQASFTTTAVLSVGSHSITAVYGGDVNYTPSTSSILNQTVNQGMAPTMLTASATSVQVGVLVTFTATVSPMMPLMQGQALPTGSVQFWLVDANGNNVAPLGTVTLDASGHASLTTSFANAGTYRIKAVYTGDNNYMMMPSAIIDETVTM